MSRIVFAVAVCLAGSALAAPPNVVFVMADDMGWGQLSCMGYPHMETPHLDAMAANGLRFDRFYAGGPTCSPTRASVLTGRTPFRTGVIEHGYCLRAQEVTLPEILRDAGYVTAHFGKWHLSGYRGPGVPILPTDPYGPGAFGFSDWLTTTNFFDVDPLLSRVGTVEAFEGDSSEVIVGEALAFIRRQVTSEPERPFFAAIWYGSPHSPWEASEADRQPFEDADGGDSGARYRPGSPEFAHYHGELVAMDRSIGTLRAGLRELGIEGETLVWFCSDNGGLNQFGQEAVGGLRGGKGTTWEGGLRVPAIVEWPGHVPARVTERVAGVVDMWPTVAALAGLEVETVAPHPLDGEDLSAVLAGDDTARSRPLGFKTTRGRYAWIDGDWKVVGPERGPGAFHKLPKLFDLKSDPGEMTSVRASEPERYGRMRREMDGWLESVAASEAGADYASGRVDPVPPAPRQWASAPEYADFIAWRKGRRESPGYRPRPGG